MKKIKIAKIFVVLYQWGYTGIFKNHKMKNKEIKIKK